MTPSNLLRYGMTIRPLLADCHRRVVAPAVAKPPSNCRAFQSPAHTDNLYPGSKETDRFQVPHRDEVVGCDGAAIFHSPAFSGFIPINELQVSYSIGKDGLNRHQVPTRVDIRFHVESASWLSDEVKATVRRRYSSELTRDGYLVVKSDRTRSQMMNQADAMRKLRDAIWASLETETPKVSKEMAREIERKKQLKVSRQFLLEKKSVS